ncbi:MAG: DUF2059 domain-containing protein [Candidatus Omnitrophica bacterium]|nr:DUF2059 domain-containing protein [Candidatus Omnitrophota bacterium]
MIAIFTFMMFFCPRGYTETIYLKDGRILKEKIVQRESYYIVTEKGNIPHKYYMGQIDRIEDDTVEDRVDMKNINLKQFEEMGMPVEKAKLIVIFMDVSGVRRNMQQNLDQVISGVPEEQKDYYKNIFNVDEIIERLIPLYDKYYNEQELWDMIRFYESPAGKKILEVTPKIMEESVGVSVEYIKQKMSL